MKAAIILEVKFSNEELPEFTQVTILNKLVERFAREIIETMGADGIYASVKCATFVNRPITKSAVEDALK